MVFVRDIVNAFPVSVDGVHIGVVIISSEAKLSFHFGLYTDKSTIDSVITQIPFPGGSAATGAAILKAKTELFQVSKREAAKVRRFVWLHGITIENSVLTFVFFQQSSSICHCSVL